MEKMKRMSKQDYYLDIALAVSKRSSCLKRHYGCVIVNNDEIVSTGYNGSPRGDVNCCDTGECKRVHGHNKGDYSDCCSVHAEQNAIISASREKMFGSVMYIACEEYTPFTDFGLGVVEKWDWVEIFNCEPCPICKRMIKNAGVSKVVTRSNSGILSMVTKGWC